MSLMRIFTRAAVLSFGFAVAIGAAAEATPLASDRDMVTGVSVTVATCYLPDGTDIARELVHRGWALDCAHYSHGRYRADEPSGVRQRLSQAPYC
jgi:hypothetical protein